MLVLAPLDLVLYRPIIVWARLLGSWRFLRGDKGWHKFERNVRAPGVESSRLRAGFELR